MIIWLRDIFFIFIFVLTRIGAQLEKKQIRKSLINLQYKV